MTVLDFLAVAVGGFTGAIIRYTLSKKLNMNSPLPYGTLLANSLGCILVGFVFALELPVALTFLLVSGFAGSLTTYSTWIKEVLGMSGENERRKAGFYLVGTVIIGLVLVYVGHTVGIFVV